MIAAHDKSGNSSCDPNVAARARPTRESGFNLSDPSLRLEVGKEFEPDADFKRLFNALENASEPDA